MVHSKGSQVFTKIGKVLEFRKVNTSSGTSLKINFERSLKMVAN